MLNGPHGYITGGRIGANIAAPSTLRRSPDSYAHRSRSERLFATRKRQTLEESMRREQAIRTIQALRRLSNDKGALGNEATNARLAIANIISAHGLSENDLQPTEQPKP